MLFRLALRPDRAFLLAALGVAAGILLPLVGNLILAGLRPTVDGSLVVYDVEGPLQVPDGAEWVVAQSISDPQRYAYVVGDPHVAPGGILAMPAAVAEGVPRGGPLDGVPEDALLVHPNDLGPSTNVIAGFLHDRPDLHADGRIVALGRGVDAFEVVTTDALRSQGIWLLGLSLPAVAIVSLVFTRQEVRARQRQTAVLAALGRDRIAILLLATRVIACVAFGAIAATTVGFLLYSRGPALLHPDDAPRGLLVLSILLPSAVAAIIGVLATARAARRLDILRADATGDEDDVPLRVPARARPLLLGLRPLGLLLVAALLFLADVGFPMAAAKVPASLGGARDEWVFGAEDGIMVGRGIDAAAVPALAHHPDVGAVLAETLSPTLVGGKPLVVRGGEWQALANYHGLRISEGSRPDGESLALGERAARRLDASVGDDVVIQQAARAGLLHVKVAGIVAAPGLLQDEAFVGEHLGRTLAGISAGDAMIIRLRPATQATLAALGPSAPDIHVVALTTRADPPTGSLAFANATLVNLGTEPGQRTLHLRVNGLPAASVVAQVGGLALQEVRIPFVVPHGKLLLELNPTAETGSGPSTVSWAGPGKILLGTPYKARLEDDGKPVAGVDIGLFRDIQALAEGRPADRNVTNAEGFVRLLPTDSGEWLVSPMQEPDAVTKFVVLDENGGLTVTDLWCVPAIPIQGEPAIVRAFVRNTGTGHQAYSYPASADGIVFAYAQGELEAGEGAVLEFPLRPMRPIQELVVGDRTLTFDSLPAPSTPQAPEAVLPPAQDAVPGNVAQRQVADRALGDANAILAGLATAATVTTLTVLVLATQRALAGRRHVVGLLVALGWDADRIRQRAAWEGAALGAVAAVLALAPAKVAFLAMGAWGPAVFAHGLPDPIQGLFVFQSFAAFAGVCALAAYFGSGKAVR